MGSSNSCGSGNSTTTANYHYGSTSNKASSSIHDYAVRIQQSAAKNLPKINCEVSKRKLVARFLFYSPILQTKNVGWRVYSCEIPRAVRIVATAARPFP